MDLEEKEKETKKDVQTEQKGLGWQTHQRCLLENL